jgi:hypothetical protein
MAHPQPLPDFVTGKGQAVAIENDTSFRSRAEMEAVARKYNRNAKVAGLLGAGTVFGLILLDLPMAILYDKTPTFNFIETHYWQTALGVGLVLMLFTRTEFFEREVNAVGRANLIVREYERGISDLEKGIKAASAKLVNRGMERLERLESSCSEVPEFQEMLVKGRSWRRANDKPDLRE